MISLIIPLLVSLYASFSALPSLSGVWILTIYFIVAVILTKLVFSYLEKALLHNFEAYLRQKIMQRDWPVEMTFPLKEQIEVWIYEYKKSVKGYPSTHIWARITEGDAFQRWVGILKKLSVSVIGVNGGIRLFDLYYLTSVDVSNADPNETDSSYKLERTRTFLEFMPVQDLIGCIETPIVLNEQVLYCLMIRDEKVGNFNEFCSSFMETNRQMLASMAVIEQLISETNAQVPVVFPKEFLAYLIKKEAENTHGFEVDPEKRKKVLSWYASQKKQDIDRKFFFCWPKLTQEEIPVIFKLFDEKSVRDEIFLRHRFWKYVPVELLVTKMYTNTKDTSLLDEIAKRLRK